VDGFDPQESALADGKSPNEPEFGSVVEDGWGRIGISPSTEQVETLSGSYSSFYRIMSAAILNHEPTPVALTESIAVLKIIEQAVLASRAPRLGSAASASA
jgi:hypothetical protein